MLLALPVRLDAFRQSGIAATVSDRVPAHPNHAIKDAAAAVLARWSGRPAPAPAAAPEPRRPKPPASSSRVRETVQVLLYNSIYSVCTACCGASLGHSRAAVAQTGIGACSGCVIRTQIFSSDLTPMVQPSV